MASTLWTYLPSEGQTLMQRYGGPSESEVPKERA